MKCYCNVPGLGRNHCPMHHRAGARNFTRNVIRRSERNSRLRHGGGTLNKRKLDTTVDMSWSLEEIKALDKEELWVVCNLLKLPQSAPTVVTKRCTIKELRRHCKARLNMYSEDNMEIYYKAYPSMRPVLEGLK